MDEFRPEYIEAVSDAAWNHWFAFSLAIPPAILLLLFLSKSRWPAIMIGSVVAAIACWLCFGMGVHYIWDIKELHAETNAERADVTADTAELFAPAVIGVPYATIYTCVTALSLTVFRWIIRAMYGSNQTDSKPN